jgi:hypothetical protein
MLKRIVTLVAISISASTPGLGQQGPALNRSVMISRHTALRFALLQPLDSGTAKVGDDVPLRLTRPLVVDGVTVLPAGAFAHGRITRVKRPRMCYEGELDWKLKRITFPDSTTAKTAVAFVDSKPDAQVPSSFRLSHQGDDISTRDALSLLAVTAVVWPYLLADEALHHDEKGCSLGPEYYLPANSTVAVVLTRSHRVRMLPDPTIGGAGPN